MDGILCFCGKVVVYEVMAPGAGSGDERLHKGALGLDSVVEVVGCPLVEELGESNRAQHGMGGLPGQVFGPGLGETLQVVTAMLKEELKHLGGRVPGIVGAF